MNPDSAHAAPSDKNNALPGRAPKPPRPKPDELIRRQDEAYRRYLLGASATKIGEDFGLCDRQIKKYIRAARDRLAKEILEMEGRAGVLRQFTILNHIIDEALDGWERSKKSKMTKTSNVKRVGVKGAKASDPHLVEEKVGKKEEDKIGDRSFLDQALRASAELRTLLGMDAEAAQRLLLANLPQGAVNDEDLNALSAEELFERYKKTVRIG